MNDPMFFDRAVILCRDEGLCRLLVTELALCGVAVVPEGEPCDLWLVDLDDGCTPSELPEDGRLLCWSRRPMETVAPDVKSDDRVCFLHRPFGLLELESCVRRLVAGETAKGVRPVPFDHQFGRQYDHSVGGQSPNRRKGPRVLPLEKGVVAVDGVTVTLTPKEWALFACLWDRQGRLVPKSVLWEALCAVCEDGIAATNTLEVYICHLRRKLEKPIAGRIITTVRGKGYRLDVP